MTVGRSTHHGHQEVLVTDGMHQLLLVVSENSNHTSTHQLVLVDQSAQTVVSMYPSRMVPEMPVPTVRNGHGL